MSFRFWRRIRIAPGVTLNLSKSGGSFSFGPRGAKFTVGSRGGRATVGLPGTGIFYTQTLSPGKGRRRRVAPSRTPAIDSGEGVDRLTLGFFKRLVTSDDEKALVDGCRELFLGHEDVALAHLEKAVHLADGAYLAGFLALRKGRAEEGAKYLAAAAKMHDRLGGCFSKYGVSAMMTLPITGEIAATVGPDLRGVLLGLVEAYQRLDRRRDAAASLEKLRRLEPDDVVVKLSLAEVLLEGKTDRKAAAQKVVRLCGGVTNETALHATLMLYKGRALRRLALPTAARDVLTAALRRRKDRSGALLKAIRYERALVYEELGRKGRSRGELEKLYAEDPDYEDVARRLGL